MLQNIAYRDEFAPRITFLVHEIGNIRENQGFVSCRRRPVSLFLSHFEGHAVFALN